MTLLGLDYGRRKIGVALGQGQFVEPLITVFHQKKESALNEILRLCERYAVDGLVLGLPLNREGLLGPLAEEVKDFGRELAEKVKPRSLAYFDETLSSKRAQSEMHFLGLGKKRRRQKEDAFAAAALLEDYLESLKTK